MSSISDIRPIITFLLCSNEALEDFVAGGSQPAGAARCKIREFCTREDISNLVPCNFSGTSPHRTRESHNPEQFCRPFVVHSKKVVTLGE
jgi:hypothetical protein